MTKRILLGGLIGGVVLFLWGAASHLFLRWVEPAIQQIPNEDAVLGLMKTNLTEPGFYFFPGLKESPAATKEQSDAAKKSWEEKYRAGPHGVLIYQPRGEQPMSPQQLLAQLAFDVASALVAALLLASASGPSGYGSRFIFVAVLGLLPCLVVNLPYWNWYGFPTEFMLRDAADRIVGFWLAGLFLAAIVKKGPPPADAGNEGADAQRWKIR